MPKTDPGATAPKLLTVREVAKRLGISARMVWALRAGGDLPAIKLSRRCTRFAEADVAAFVERAARSGGRR